MKKLNLFLTALLAVSVATCAGCMKNDTANNHEDQPGQQTRDYRRDSDNENMPEPDRDGSHSRCPRVKIGHGNGYAVGYRGEFEGGEFFVIQFGSGECPVEFPECPSLPEENN